MSAIYQVDASCSSLHTISSPHIGQTILELAAAAACAVACSSRATRDVMSSFSVDIGVLEVCELSDIELSEGDRPPDARNCGLFGTGGARFLPLPRTLPPPKLRLAAMILTPPQSGTSRETGRYYERTERATPYRRAAVCLNETNGWSIEMYVVEYAGWLRQLAKVKLPSGPQRAMTAPSHAPGFMLPFLR